MMYYSGLIALPGNSDATSTNQWDRKTQCLSRTPPPLLWIRPRAPLGLPPDSWPAGPLSGLHPRRGLAGHSSVHLRVHVLVWLPFRQWLEKKGGVDRGLCSKISQTIYISFATFRSLKMLPQFSP